MRLLSLLFVLLLPICSLQAKEEPVPLTVVQNIASGQVLQVSNGSFYAIHPKDVPLTSMWITPVEIEVKKGSPGEFPLVLIDKNSKTAVSARLVSASEAEGIIEKHKQR